MKDKHIFFQSALLCIFHNFDCNLAGGICPMKCHWQIAGLPWLLEEVMGMAEWWSEGGSGLVECGLFAHSYYQIALTLVSSLNFNLTDPFLISVYNLLKWRVCFLKKNGVVSILLLDPLILLRSLNSNVRYNNDQCWAKFCEWIVANMVYMYCSSMCISWPQGDWLSLLTIDATGCRREVWILAFSVTKKGLELILSFFLFVTW